MPAKPKSRAKELAARDDADDGTVDAVYFGEGELVVDGQTLVDLS